jgi:high-affinity Fe2+/Pb2+ permease
VPEERKRPAALEFLSGLFFGIGLILLTWLAAVLTLSTFQNYLPHYGPSDGPHRIAVLWAVLAFGLGFLLFQFGVRHKRQSSFVAGLVTAGALFLLLDAACWSFTLG